MAKRKSLATNKILLAVLIIVGIFLFMMMLVPQIPTSAETPESLMKFIEWFVDLRSHFEQYVGLYALIIAVLGVGGYFVVKSK
ncbi:hypothetical protein [Acholeplasma hippikon]|uniref:Uncharacterized protein n=2 Tax=Acholeplasma hippikon TaxID=264636 RepID=A0A449BL39_9MOLU|nr:hypothetical protein [Acholeplasma hippikon]VEU83142.1 Uncharacterised protein [Acholeplasma hippikon]VEU83347.1 Uncharacterised protein [Acholeplasma hippikon]